MANSTLTVTLYAHPYGSDNTQRNQRLRGTIAISASPGTYPTGGYSLNNTFAIEAVKSTLVNKPGFVSFYSVSGSGYEYYYNRANNKLQVFTGSAAQSPSAELSAGSTPAGVSGDTIEFLWEVPRED
jgi:hypothetical protein